MSNKIKAPLKIKVKASLKGLYYVLKQPKYLIGAIVLGFFMSGFIIWSLNFDLVKYIVFDAPITFFDKVRFFWDVQTGIYTAYTSTQATGIILFGTLFGINTALIIKVIKLGAFKNIPKKSGGAGLILALLSGGCVACGTSILAPLLATLGATSSAFTSELSNYFNWFGIILITYSIYKLGGVINTVRHQSESDNTNIE